MATRIKKVSAAARERARKKRRAMKSRTRVLRLGRHLSGGHHTIHRVDIGQLLRAAQKSKQVPTFDVSWDIPGLTTRDASILLQSIERSLNETAIDVLLTEGVPSASLSSYKDGARLLDLGLTDAAVGSFKLTFKIEYSSKAKSESWLKSVAKGVLKKIAVAWISAIVLAGPQQDGGKGGAPVDPAHPGSKSVPTLIASLAQTGKPSTLNVSMDGQKPARLKIDAA